VGGVQFDLTAEHVKAVFEPFGKILSVQMIPNPETGKHKGYGFIEFEDPQAAQEAIEQMNGFDLCGRQLKVGLAHAMLAQQEGSTPTPQQLAAMAKAKAASLAAHTSSSEPENLGREENIRINASQRLQIMQKLSRNESPVLVLKNMVLPQDVDDELSEEVRDECSKYGKVEKVLIHHNKAEDSILIFVQFSNQDEAGRARQALDRRYFGGRVIQAEYYPKEKFELGVYQ